MRERTFIASMVGLDMMLILAGAAMSWSYALPSKRGAALTGALAHVDTIDGIISTILIAGIGAYALYAVNGLVFRLVESRSTERNARLVAGLFAAAAIAGGAAGLAMG